MNPTGRTSRLPALTRARIAWGDALPDWVEAWARAADGGALRGQWKRSYSAATFSQVINRKYPSNLAKVEAAVRLAIMSQQVACPVLGEISGAECSDNQRAPYQPQNPQRVALYAACRNCLNRLEGRS